MANTIAKVEAKVKQIKAMKVSNKDKILKLRKFKDLKIETRCGNCKKRAAVTIRLVNQIIAYEIKKLQNAK